MASRTSHLTALIVAAAVVLLAASLSPAAEGLIVSVAGEVQVHRGDAEAAAREGYVLREGDMLVVMPGATCTGFSPVGESFDLKGPAELEFAGSGGVVKEVSSWVRLQLAEWIGESRRQPLTTRNVRDWSIPTDAPAQIIPAPEGRVRPGKSRFFWSTLTGVERYVLTLAPAMGDEQERVARDHSTVVEDLRPGEEYVWKVRPEVEGWEGDTRWRGFTVLTADEERELDHAIDELDDLEAGVLLLSAGLHEEAIYRFDAALTVPELSRSARLWRAQALADLGLYRQAYEDLVSARGQE
jgi:hypothetical protein